MSATLVRRDGLQPILFMQCGPITPAACIDNQRGKTSVCIIDWLDLGHPITQRMWERRLRGYRAMGYALNSDP